MTPRLAYVAGPGRSGSTLLGLLLNNHPDICSLGEVHRVGLCAAEGFQPCTCGMPVAECAFWCAVDRDLAKRLGRPGESILATTQFALDPREVSPVAGALQKGLLVGGARRAYGLFAPRWVPAHHAAVGASLELYESVRAVSGARVVVDSTKDARRLAALYFADPKAFRVLYMIRDGRAVAASEMRREGIGMDLAAR
ncbi:MAG: hypothetical protein KC416_13795, partial [Myxococcales bacterium]|nr:hypothetical protein [Myxococcales bacterium]